MLLVVEQFGGFQSKRREIMNLLHLDSIFRSTKQFISHIISDSVHDTFEPKLMSSVDLKMIILTQPMKKINNWELVWKIFYNRLYVKSKKMSFLGASVDDIRMCHDKWSIFNSWNEVLQHISSLGSICLMLVHSSETPIWKNR